MRDWDVLSKSLILERPCNAILIIRVISILCLKAFQWKSFFLMFYAANIALARKFACFLSNKHRTLIFIFLNLHRAVLFLAVAPLVLSNFMWSLLKYTLWIILLVQLRSNRRKDSLSALYYRYSCSLTAWNCLARWYWTSFVVALRRFIIGSYCLLSYFDLMTIFYLWGLLLWLCLSQFDLTNLSCEAQRTWRLINPTQRTTQLTQIGTTTLLLVPLSQRFSIILLLEY